MTAWLLRRAAPTPTGRRDLAVLGGRWVEPGELPPEAEVLDLEGRPVIAGLVDQHSHLRALASSWTSVDVSPEALKLAGGLAPALERGRARLPTGWLRAVGYDTVASGPLDRDALDAAVAGPVRVQDRSGVMWVLDSAGLAAVLPAERADWPAGVETDATGRATGRLFRLDAWLRRRVPSMLPDLATVGRWLAGRGVTTVVDASATNGPAELDDFADAGLPQRLVVMTAEAELVAPEGVALGPVKVLLDDTSLPPLDELAARVAGAHAAGRVVAVHCVTTVQLVLALSAGLRRGDRIEHGSVIPDDVVPLVADRGVTVVTQPGLVRTRGDRYLREVDDDEVAALYRLGTLRRAGIPVAIGTDAPYGPADPWVHVAAALDRCTADGATVGVDEEVDLATALSLLQRDPLAPHKAAEGFLPGGRADFCVLDTGWTELTQDPAAVAIRSTWIGGSIVA
jgi:predicted amidohydrolase YtcJ